MQSRRENLIRLALSLSLTLFTLAFAATAGVRVRFTPKFVPGEVLRYRIESRTTTKGTTTTPIVNPEGGSQSTQTIHMVVRLDTIGASPDGKIRFRATYEKSSAESETDALDLAASSSPISTIASKASPSSSPCSRAGNLRTSRSWRGSLRTIIRWPTGLRPVSL